MIRMGFAIVSLVALGACVTEPEVLPFPVSPVPASVETDPSIKPARPGCTQVRTN